MRILGRGLAMLVLGVIAQGVVPAPLPAEAAEGDMTTVYLVFLKKGPKWSATETADSKAIQEAHMANIRRMWEEKKLILAGPTDEPADLRGVFVLKAASAEEAQSLASTDPAVKAGRLIATVYPWWVDKRALPEAGSYCTPSQASEMSRDKSCSCARRAIRPTGRELRGPTWLRDRRRTVIAVAGWRQSQRRTGVFMSSRLCRLESTLFVVGVLSLAMLASEACIGSKTSGSYVCRTTSPNGSVSPERHKFSARAEVELQGGNHGNGAISTALWPDGRVEFRPGGPGFVDPDGSLRMKWPWWHRAKGALTIEGRRLDAPAPPLRTTLPPDKPDHVGMHPMYFLFPTEGCWEITGRVGDAKLTFVTLIVKIGEGPRPWKD